MGACGTPAGSMGTPQRSVASGPGTARIRFDLVRVGVRVGVRVRVKVMGEGWGEARSG